VKATQGGGEDGVGVVVDVVEEEAEEKMAIKWKME